MPSAAEYALYQARAGARPGSAYGFYPLAASFTVPGIRGKGPSIAASALKQAKAAGSTAAPGSLYELFPGITNMSGPIPYTGAPSVPLSSAAPSVTPSAHDAFNQAVIDTMQGHGAPQHKYAVARALDAANAAVYGALPDVPDVLKAPFRDPGVQLAIGFLPGAPGVGRFGAYEMPTEAWHGTPHIWAEPKVDLGKVGTGEGAQAYGWGFYAAGKKGVADYYRDTLSAGQPRLNAARDIVAKYTGEGGLPDDGVRSLLRLAHDTDPAAPKLAGWQVPLVRGMTMADRRAMLDEIRATQPGSLYRLELQPEETDYLHWDKPLSEQSDKVKAALEKAGVKTQYDFSGYAIQPTTNAYGQTIERVVDKQGDSIGYVAPHAVHKGEWVATRFGGEHDTYPSRQAALNWLLSQTKISTLGQHAYGDLAKQLGSDQAASLALRDAGIPGIKYLDQGSRGAGEGTHNYVLFDPAHVKVLERK
jgi:hypothetical protein